MTVKELNAKLDEIKEIDNKPVILTAIKNKGKLYVIDLARPCRYNRVKPVNDNESYFDAAIRVATNLEYK